MSLTVLEERHAAIAALCSAPELDPALVEKLGGSKRWKTYRHMVRTRLFQMVRAGLPRTFAAVGDRMATELLSTWIAGGFTSSYIRDAVLSFHEAIDWGSVRERSVDWVSDLARYERSLWELRHQETPELPVSDFAFEGKPVINQASTVVALDYPIYREGTTFEPESKLVLLYRHMLTDRVGFYTLTDFQRTLLDHCRGKKQPMTACVQSAAKAHDLPIDEALLEQVSSFLAELMSRTVLIGSEA